MTDGPNVGDIPIAGLYNDATLSFIEFARTLTADEWATECPCTPGWTARDVLSHVSGVPDDGLAGRVDGAATDPWTASQVERNAHFGVEELLERWLGQYELFGAAIESMGETRPPFDCHTHEHDVRHALGKPGNRDSGIVQVGAARTMLWLAEIPVSVTIDLDDGRQLMAGRSDSDEQVGVAIDRFEIFRSRLGRRTLEQVRAYPWTGSPVGIEMLIDGWFTFGPSDLPIHEPER